MRKDVFEQYIKNYCKDLSAKRSPFDYSRCRHAAVITYNNVIIASGVNVDLHHDFVKVFDENQTLHAEQVAILRAMKHHYKIIDKCDLWVARNNKVSHLSKPCPTCQKIIKAFGISKVHYTDEHGEWKDL